MKLALPLGLLGLLALIALILIYILKPKYQDKKVSSTYVWKLSLRYQKRKVPLQWLKSSVLLVVQISIIVFLAIMMSQPYFVLNTKTGEKIVVLSASASMLAESDGVSRFDRAKDEIATLAEKTTADNDKFSVILAGDEAQFVVRRSDSEGYIKQKLADATCAYAQDDVAGAMTLAEGVLTENPNAEVYFYTDCDYDKPGKVRVVNVAKSEWNAAVLDFSAKRVKGNYVFTAEVASYGRAEEFAANIVITDADGKETKASAVAECGDGESVKLVWESLDVGDYYKAAVTLVVEDSFPYDNEFDIYKRNTESYKVLLESENAGFLYSALGATGKCRIDVVSEKLPAVTSGYDLYVYDGTYPERQPRDGAVWLIDPPRDLPSSYGITLGIKPNGDFKFAAAASTGDAFKTIMNGIDPGKFGATEYSKVLSYPGYEPIMTCNNEPVLLVKSESGLRTVVLALDIHMSTLPVELVDFPVLINNLCEYSSTRTLSETLYTVGDSVRLNPRAGVTNMNVKSAAEEQNYTEYPVTVDVTVPGIYTVTQSLESGRAATDEFFVRVPVRESLFGKNGTNLVNPVVMTTVGTDSDIENDTADIFMWIALALFVLICVEWGLQYREQY